MDFCLTAASPKGGAIRVPGSKSHTIRGLFLAALARGRSLLEWPLVSADTLSAVRVCRALGARVEEAEGAFVVDGTGGTLTPPEDVIDTGNSGTSLYLGLGLAALGRGWSVFTGDEQIRRRPVQPLIEALNALGACAFSTRGNGLAPVAVKGPLPGGAARLDCPTSQYLTSLLLASPLAENETILSLTRLNEVPYVRMTMRWLDEQRIRYEHDEKLMHFKVFGGQKYRAFEKKIPADFSSATFFAVLAAAGNCEIVLDGLDMTDTQGDRRVINILENMGAGVVSCPDKVIVRCCGELRGIEVDMNDIPDALPALAVAACFARGTTKLFNVAHARLKETDRIRVMAQELTKMGADVQEREDGLVIRESRLRGAKLSGHGDHRVVMALSVAGALAQGQTRIDTAESAGVTFPGFADLMRRVGCRLEEKA